MQGLKQHILGIAMMTLAVGLSTSCVYDEEPQPQPATPDDNSLICLSLSMPMAQAEAGVTNGYIAGEEYENYLDLSNEGYRIYFFDKDNKYITRFLPLGITSSGDKENTYDVLGVVPKELEGASDFKIVVLANWPSGYPDATMVSGTSTIDQLCEDVTAQFNCLTSFELNPDKDLTIPFFGLHHYTGVTFKKGERTTLTEPVALLRAMAKVEVVIDIKGASLSEIGLRGYNKRGYCAPAGVYKQGDYDHGGVWADDYIKTPHLIGNANDAEPEKSFIALFRKYEADGTHPETWIGYVPEYRNTNNSDGKENYKSRLELLFDFQEKNETPYEIYFQDYDTDGKAVAGSDFDILRNNLYRFTVSLSISGLVIKVKKWENAYDNIYTFE